MFAPERFAILTALVCFCCASCKTPAPPPKLPEVDPVEEAPPPEPEMTAEEKAQAALAERESRLPQGLTESELAWARLMARSRGLGAAFAGGGKLDEACGAPEFVRATNDYENGKWHPIEDCGRAVKAAHVLGSEEHETAWGPVEISSVMVTTEDAELWSLSKQCEQFAEAACASDYISAYGNVASFVGPILSFSFQWDAAMKGAPAAHGQQAGTFDVRTGSPAELDSIVTTESVVAALKADEYLQSELKKSKKKLDAATTPKEIFALWGTDKFALFGPYYFHHWSTQRGKASLRLQFLKKASNDTKTLNEIELWVDPRPEFQEAFANAAEKKAGFFVQN